MEEQKIELKIINMADIQSQEIEWLWYPFIPYGKLTIIQGDPGDGKTTLVLNLAAKLSKGIGLDEDMQVSEPMNAVIKKTEVLEKRFSALNSKAGLVDSHAREYGYYPEEWLPEARTLESAKSYRKRIFPLLKKVANMIQSLYSKYLELKDRNRKLSDRNMDLENRVDRLRDEVSIIKKENLALLNVAYDLERARNMLGKSKVDDAIAMAKRLEQVNAKQKANKKHIDRDVR